MSNPRQLRRLLPVVFVVLALSVGWLYRGPSSSVTEPAAAGGGGTIVDDSELAEPRSGQMIEVTGRVSRLLRDDNEGSRHQRFILALENGRTLLVAHNVDLAPRVPIEAGDSARIRGQYEWNDRGGVLHWTHHDPDGSRRDTGWIEHDGRIYQ